ncbi:hypothetical protein IQ276_038700 [Desmonostoc muscorum LEGE 12446]|uniref:Uncharacterized protein n=1 Tax=Desmonostoc muscorum LEGE 12446 TaxID=1828758 RepID=A0A8J7D4F1_DESMC|nr:hypothetical protein [Desmonostoc muscorum]MCF2152218.1 hypothetical protein [Desmonostoc muscorum LEGE 12446]
MRSLLKQDVPLSDADLLSLEELLFNAEAVESRERFEEVYGKNLNLKLFIRQLVGLDRNAAIAFRSLQLLLISMRN